jgi:hypothetical protein
MRKLALLLCSLPSLLFAATASSIPITFGFTATAGTVTEGPPGFTSGLNPGDSFSGQFTFESTTADANASTGFGDYQGALIGVKVFLPDGVLSLDNVGVSTNQIQVTVPGAYNVDYAELAGSGTYGGQSLFTGIFQLDASGPFADDSLPLDPTTLGTAAISRIYLARPDAANIEILNSTVTSLSLAPEPGLLVLLATGAALLVTRRVRLEALLR